MAYALHHDTAQHRFVARLEDGAEAFVEYHPIDQGAWDITYTFVPPTHRHRGIGERIVVAVLEHARERDLRVIPTCPFVPHVIASHPEYASLVRG